MTSRSKLRVLLTNDDGPPGPHSPYIYGFYRHLTRDLGWDVKVVIPSSQKSWIGAAFQIQDIIRGRFYFPRDPDGMGETSDKSRPLADGEVAEWILLDGTPSTCTNVALHNLYPGEIDLVISGPNLGRNTSAAFSLSSGTLGGALSGALSRVRALALSYGTMTNPVTPDLHVPAHALAARVLAHLCAHWAPDPAGLRGEVDLYSVNVPMVPALHDGAPLPVRHTSVWRNGYGRLFAAHAARAAPALAADAKRAEPGGPDEWHGAPADPDPDRQGDAHPDPAALGALVFKWAPDMHGVLNPTAGAPAPAHSDSQALADGCVSVSALRACFAQPELGDDADLDLGTVML